MINILMNADPSKVVILFVMTGMVLLVYTGMISQYVKERNKR